MVPWVLGLGGIEHLTVPWVLGLGAEWHRASHGPVGPGSGCWVAGLSAWGSLSAVQDQLAAPS